MEERIFRGAVLFDVLDVIEQVVFPEGIRRVVHVLHVGRVNLEDSEADIEVLTLEARLFLYFLASSADIKQVGIKLHVAAIAGFFIESSTRGRRWFGFAFAGRASKTQQLLHFSVVADDLSVVANVDKIVRLSPSSVLILSINSIDLPETT